jgi:release factor glutamine methyltransferase
MSDPVQLAIRETVSVLRRAGVPEPRREALILAAWATDASTAAVLAYPERELRRDEEARLRQAVRRRVRREPLAYITGRVEFFGLELEVDRRVIVPRPETEHVVEHALAVAREVGAHGPVRAVGAQHVAKSLCDRHPGPQGLGAAPLLIADVGAGSGCIAVALAHSLQRAAIYATDASADALEVAAANVRRHRLEARVRLLEGDLLAPLPAPVHVIASNPPYVATGEFAGLMPEVRDFEPRSALDGGADGLSVIRRLIEASPARLLAGGALVMEIGAGQGEAVLALARERFRRARIERDLAGHDRVLIAER